MEMEGDPFPSFNHPFYPDGGHQQTFIDYGSVSTLNIDIDNDGRVVTTSKHRHYDKESDGTRLVEAHLTLPLFAPCKNVFTDKVFPEQRCRIHNSNFKQSLLEQTSDFYKNHPDIAFQSSVEFVGEELHCKPWDPKCFYYSKTIQMVHMTKRQHLNPNNFLDRFCDLFVTFPLSKDLGLMLDKRYALPRGLCEAFHDIPPQLLFDLLNESVEQRKNEKLYFDILQGNTLAYCNMPDSESGQDIVLFYPSGPCLEVLNSSIVRLKDTGTLSDKSRKLYRKPALLTCSKNEDGKGTIRQISAVSYEHGNTFVATRSQYGCTFFSATISTTKDSPEITLKAIDNLVKEDQAMSLALSPYIPGEGVVAMETGQVYIWHLGKQVETRDVPMVAPKENWPWYQCVYASHPRCILIANSVEADIMDLRASGSFSRNLFSVTSKQVSTLERISAIQRNPENTHHYVIATDQSLLIMDDRFIQHPVLKWRHHLQDPVQYIEVINSAVPRDTVITVSGSQHHETHCFQYNWGECDVRYTFPYGGENLVNPPVSTVLPWKVSSYDEWPSHVPTSILPISSLLDDRLSQPLIGVCCIPLSSKEDRKGFTAFQMSSAGDLFYQPFIQNDKGKGRIYRYDPSTSKDSKNVRFSDADITFLKSWIDELVAMANENDEYNEWPLRSNMLETDCEDLFRKMMYLELPHQSCFLCNPSTANSYATVQEEQDNDEECVCPRCEIDVKNGRQVKKCQTLNIQCREKIKSEVQCVDLNFVNNADSYKDPLSQNLFQNWFSDTHVPLNLGSTDKIDKEKEVPTIASNVNVKNENKNEKQATKETSTGESSQLNNEVLAQKIFESVEEQSFDLPMKELSEPSTVTPLKCSEPIQSPLKVGNVSPRKQVKRIKRLNQSMGF
ncbi:uncharacterized protein LOC116305938 isoform X1 [Actinia tenebrosa]|uniref:Uncharacterized protein LOC116305938 isoform X1 n=1 Tax=Actinia tenebrosa TaxID=6105 RepID=A0A6P8J288_ACTTE|nr:uncharacterized protein LOC116305938 isoform X1 [Actinia tenebrosa]